MKSNCKDAYFGMSGVPGILDRQDRASHEGPIDSRSDTDSLRHDCIIGCGFMDWAHQCILMLFTQKFYIFPSKQDWSHS